MVLDISREIRGEFKEDLYFELTFDKQMETCQVNQVGRQPDGVIQVNTKARKDFTKAQEMSHGLVQLEQKEVQYRHRWQVIKKFCIHAKKIITTFEVQGLGNFILNSSVMKLWNHTVSILSGQQFVLKGAQLALNSQNERRNDSRKSYLSAMVLGLCSI